MKDYNKLYKKYLYKKEQLSFSIDDIERILIKKFKAREFPKETLLDLKNDDELRYNEIYKCFTIEEPEVLINLYSSEEKANHREEIKDNHTNPLDPKKVNDWDFVHIIYDEQEGRRINIVLESKDGEFVSNFKVRSESETVNRYLNALVCGGKLEKGIAEFNTNINDEYFRFYLENLDLFGFINQ